MQITSSTSDFKLDLTIFMFQWTCYVGTRIIRNSAMPTKCLVKFPTDLRHGVHFRSFLFCKGDVQDKFSQSDQ